MYQVKSTLYFLFLFPVLSFDGWMTRPKLDSADEKVVSSDGCLDGDGSGDKKFSLFRVCISRQKEPSHGSNVFLLLSAITFPFDFIFFLFEVDDKLFTDYDDYDDTGTVAVAEDDEEIVVTFPFLVPLLVSFAVSATSAFGNREEEKKRRTLFHGRNHL